MRGSLKEWTGEHWKVSDVFDLCRWTRNCSSGSCIICSVQKEDPAVLVIDELGKYCIQSCPDTLEVPMNLQKNSVKCFPWRP